MIRSIVIAICVLCIANTTQAQQFKPTPTFKSVTGELKVNAGARPELAHKRANQTVNFTQLNQLEALRSLPAHPHWKFAKDPVSGQVIGGRGVLEKKSWDNIEDQADAYLRVLAGLEKSSSEMGFIILSKNDSPTGTHLRFQQTFDGLPILGSEGILHAKDGVIHSFSSRIKPGFELDSAPTLNTVSALIQAKERLTEEGIQWQNIPEEKLWLIENAEQVKSNLKIGWNKTGEAKLVWEMSLYPNIQERWVVLVDAHSGTVYSCIPAFCRLWNDPNHQGASCGHDHAAKVNSEIKTTSVLPGPATAQAVDLLGVTRTINVYEEGGTFYMIDAARSMFNSSLSQFPNNPQGVIWTLDAFNTYPENSNFTYDHVSSSNNSWNNPNGVSAHFNGGKAFEYFQNTHSRNSINGQGGNIISMIRVSDPMGNDFDNAFWNGAAMFYGNGDQAFTASLAKGLDVAGHEMSHGVIQATANLVYQKQSGALNESFADIFGAMIDRDDWFIGEDISNPSVFPSGRMRDLSDPNNGGNANNFYWQPKHMNEYKNLPNTKEGDWGGVHVNSGIPNYAFFLFASNVGKDDAEKVYYEVLENHLTANSQFVDLRIATVQVASDMLGPNGKAAAEQAFDQVGIEGGEGTDVQQDINENPGDEVVIWSDLSNMGFYYPESNTEETFSNRQHITRPSITDDGSYAVYIDAQNRIIQVDINWTTGALNESFFENNPQTVWRNVAVSKDGTKISLLSTNNDRNMLVFDFVTGTSQNFELYNPTTAQGVNTGDVQFADVMEWDVSGEFIMYDAFNELQTTTLEDISYWDIGLVRVWNNNSNNFAEGQVQKVFSGLQENESVGNPTFSKNSPYIIAFDYITTDFFGTDEYKILGGNIETGDVGEIFVNGKLGYPSFAPDDSEVLFSAENIQGQDVLGRRDLAENKITGINDPVVLVNGPLWGHWFANGERELVSTFNSINGILRIYPNPADQLLQLEMQDLDKGNYQIRLLDLLGRQVLEESLNINSSFAKKTLELTALSAGTYFLRITNENGQGMTRKVMIK